MYMASNKVAVLHATRYFILVRGKSNNLVIQSFLASGTIFEVGTIPRQLAPR